MCRHCSNVLVGPSHRSEEKSAAVCRQCSNAVVDPNLRKEDGWKAHPEFDEVQESKTKRQYRFRRHSRGTRWLEKGSVQDKKSFIPERAPENMRKQLWQNDVTEEIIGKRKLQGIENL